MSGEPTWTVVPVTTRDGRRLHAERAGAGDPIVVFEAGMGASRNMWGAVAPLAARRTTTVVYDRSGLGRSPADPQPRRLDRLADDLVDLLDAIDPDRSRRVVLVGHSWGGPIVRVAAARVPDRIAGIVLVDQTDETCDLFFSPTAERQARWTRPVMIAAARLGLTRLAVRGLASKLPGSAAASMRREDGTVLAVRTMQDELAGHVDDLRLLRDDPPATPPVPLTVISGARRSRLERAGRDDLIEAHRHRAEASPLGRHVLAEQSSHYVPFSEPELIADEIAPMLTTPTRPR